MLQAQQSIGGIGQLALDAMINSLGDEVLKVGCFISRDVLPAAGNDGRESASPGQLATSAELYFQSPSRFFLLFRAPTVPGRGRSLAADLAAWVKERGVRRVMVLGSFPALFQSMQMYGLDAGAGAGGEGCGIQGTAWSPRSSPDQASASCPLLGEWSQGSERWQQANIARLDTERASDRPEEERRCAPWPLLYQFREHEIPYVALLKPTTEGNNTLEGLQMYRAAFVLLARTS